MKYLVVLFLACCSDCFSEVYLCRNSSEAVYYSDRSCKKSEIQKLIKLRPVNGAVPLIEQKVLSNGYELFMGPERIGHEPEWTIAQAIEHYRWYKNKNSRTETSKAYYNTTLIVLN